ncbi:MAG TPA: ribbon-helix-helix protein, CopG family [Caulobacterales bacterium]|nr:ribbon-helix-helix protein, CopG family [Caulobacterales bacterium]
MRDLQPKKSEKLEVRLDHETKRALQAKASSEGLSVSDAVRGLIERYIGDALSSSFVERRKQIMRHSSLAAAIAAAFGIAATLATPANATDVTIGVASELMLNPPEGPLPELKGNPHVSVALDFNTPVLICAPKASGAAVQVAPANGSCSFDVSGGYSLLMWARPGEGRSVLVGWRLLGEGAASGLMVGPELLIADGENASSWISIADREHSVLGMDIALAQH